MILEKAHSFCIHNRELIHDNTRCGCFHCKNIFSGSEIEMWIDRNTTACCPFCGIDAVLPETCGYPVTKQFLEKMYERWFENKMESTLEQFMQLRNEQDYLDFASLTNGLHDGYIISADYRKSVEVIERNHYLHHMPDLTLKILVTSMKDHPVVEIHFSGVRDMALRGGFSDIFGFTMKWGTTNNLLHEPYVQWCTEADFDWENPDKHTTYVIATAAEWRFTREYYDADNSEEAQ